MGKKSENKPKRIRVFAPHMPCRHATHAGSWYTQQPQRLSEELKQWLAQVDASTVSNASSVRAIIGPHAGYAYSGPTAAYAYRFIDPTKVYALDSSELVTAE